MTVSSSTNKVNQLGNGVTVDVPFPYVFFATTDLLVTLFDTATNLDVTPAPVLNGTATYDYIVTGTFDADTGEYTGGGTVTFNTAPPTGVTITVERVVPPTQAVVLIDNSKFPANTVNGALDRLTVLVQRCMQLMDQALTYPSSDPSTVTNTLPPAGERASMFLAFDASGNPIASTGPISGGTTPISTFWATTIQLASAALSRVALAVPGLGDNNTYTGTQTFNGSVSLIQRVQVFAANGTYTPNAKMVYCVAEGVGGGGGGGGTANSGSTVGCSGGSGGAGGYSRITLLPAAIGASKAVAIGAAGAAGTSGNNAGGNGGDTTLGTTLMVAKGAAGGSGCTGAAAAAGGLGGIAGTGDIAATGAPGSGMQIGVTSNNSIGASGGSSRWGGGGIGVATATTAAGAAATGKGGGGSGGVSYNAGGAAAGGAGTIGYLIVTEFCSA